MKFRIFRIVSSSFLVLLMCVIFVFSSENSNASLKTSGNVIRKISLIVDKDFKSYDTEKQNEIIDKYQHFVRKTAHFSIYLLLGAVSLLAVITYHSIKFRFRLAISALICLIYALSDEFHQMFVSGRSGQVSDVLLDFSGACLGILIAAAIIRGIKCLYKAVRWSINEERL